MGRAKDYIPALKFGNKINLSDLLGGGYLTTGSSFFVHSGTGNDNNRGTDEENALATIDAAIGKCTAGKNDIIYVMPGHAESVTAAAGIVCDVAGITIIGLGNGENRPIITFATATAASITATAANITWRNVVFKCNIASQSHMFDLAATDFTVEDCDFREGSATGLSFITADTADADSDRLTIRRCRFYSPTTTSNMDNAIQLAKDFASVRIEDCEIKGEFDDAGIHLPAGGNACADLQIKRCVIQQLLTNAPAISVNGTSCSGVIRDTLLITDTQATALDNGSLATDNVRWTDETDQVSSTEVLAPVDSVSNAVGVNDSNNAFSSSNVVADL